MHEGRSQSSQPERETMEKKRPGATTGKASASKETTPSSTEEETSEESRDNSSRTSGREEEKEHRSSSSSSPTGPLVQLMTRTGYNIYQQNGQRRYGPPPDWTGSPPRGCEVFVGKIPRDCLEDELVPVFEKAGPVYEMRLMMECNDLNRGYAFVVYCKATDAKKSVKMLNNYEIRKGRTLGVCMSVDNCRLFVGGIPKRVNKENIKEEMERVTEGVTDVIMYPSASDKTKNRGFAFVEYVSHRAAAMARRKLMNGRIQLWNHVIAVDWAEPELKVDEEIMAKVKVLYVRNLMLTTAESQITEAFSAHAPIERVKKIRDYAFIHFHTRNGALTAMEAMNGATLDGAVIEVTLAKPVDKEGHARNTTRRQKSASPTIPSYSVLPIDYPLMSSLCFPPPSPKVISRNSLGAKVMRSPTNTKGKPRVFFPPLSFPQSHLVFPASPVHGPYMPQYMESPKRPQVSEEAVYDIVPGLDISPAHPHQAPPSQQSSLKQPRVPVQVLEELCIKSNWGQPLYCLHNATSTPEGQLFQYKVHIPALGTTYIPSKFCRSVDEAQFTAAEYALIQLGCPLEGSSYPPHAPPFTGVPSPLPPVETLAVAAAIPPPATYSHHPTFVGLPATSKTHPSRPAPPTLSSDPTIFTGFEPTPFPVPPPHTLAYSPHAELYHRNF